MLQLAKDNRRVRVVLEDLAPVSWTSGVLTLRPAPGTHLAAESLRSEIEQLASSAAGVTKGESFQLAFTPPEQAPAQDSGSTSEAVAQHPLVKRAIELLGARVVAVQPRKPSS